MSNADTSTNNMPKDSKVGSDSKPKTDKTTSDKDKSGSCGC